MLLLAQETAPDQPPAAPAALIFSCLALVISLASAFVHYLFYRSQLDPHVILYVTEESGGFIVLVIENIGKGMAREVSFDLSKPIRDLSELNPLVTGLPALGPGARRAVILGVVGMKRVESIRECKVPDGGIDVTVRFRGDRWGPFPSVRRKVTYPVEVESLICNHTLSGADSELLRRIVSAIERSGPSVILS